MLGTAIVPNRELRLSQQTHVHIQTRSTIHAGMGHKTVGPPANGNLHIRALSTVTAECTFHFITQRIQYMDNEKWLPDLNPVSPSSNQSPNSCKLLLQ